MQKIAESKMKTVVTKIYNMFMPTNRKSRTNKENVLKNVTRNIIACIGRTERSGILMWFHFSLFFYGFSWVHPVR